MGHARKLFRSRGRRAPRRLVIASAVTSLALVAGCSGGGDDDARNEDGTITITMGLFGVMGYAETDILERYEAEHPGIEIEAEVAGDEPTYYTALQTHLAAGSGLKDIQGIEIARAAEMVQTQANRFADFADVPDTDHFLPWKQGQVTTPDGRVIGLGTDTGPMAICYRKDMFEQAGLPTDREEVGALWADDWSQYAEVGEQFMANSQDPELFYTDSASGLFNAMIYGHSEQFYNAEGDLIYADNPVVTEAWDLSSEVAESGMTAGLRQFQRGWDPGLANSTFATTTCPAWMLAHISEKAGEANAGLWDVAPAPQGANWGGSFLGVMEDSPVKEEAMDLVAWLTAPEQQAYLFEEMGIFPSSQEAMESEAVRTGTSEYFSDAPIGEIFSAAATEIPDDLVLGRKDGTIKDAFAQGLNQIEAQGESPDAAWEAVDENAQRAAG
ncbi:ABC transporter substrate-binding protein [Streptomyces litchfieldiae]|uniref:Extracellular solute-binding protein n=1 Tax=Streptomyces litchfieldiae TaxID=3075543 RepID=A0ABU2MUM2_9ACTN|nr:extracellular solute-binding protein [Streptomyces sp. DSM 44938]MDT0345341.1 extracellular solute-binding protein [Streptomyces sp. DSM 44938]